jgi:uncharacterized protein
MRALSRFAAAAIAGLWLGLPAAHAQEPSKAAIAAAREVIVLKGGGAMFNPITHGVIETVKDSYLRTNPNLSRELNEVALAIHNEIETNNSGELLDEVAKVYARHFTEPELKNLLVFYKTPLGQKWAKEEPLAIEEGLGRAKDWTDTYAETLMARFRTEMRKKGSPL